MAVGGGVKFSVTVGCLVFGVAALSGCSESTNCSVNYRGGCVPGPVAPPVAVAPVPSSPAPVRPAVPFGDPSTFADVDDKQCRSYGLTFGSHDYADCRIRLSAQHRGLDPNIGTRAISP
jgi:hypothetical protein